MKRRPINKDKYGISKHRYLEVIHHCLQYPEWREELENMTDTVKAIQYGQEGKGSPSQASATERLAIKRAELQEKCERIEHIVDMICVISRFGIRLIGISTALDRRVS